MSKQTWPDRIRCLRAFLGASQKRFAVLFGTTEVTVCCWENDRTAPSLHYATLFELLEYAVTVHDAGDVVRWLNRAAGDPKELVCIAVWMTCPGDAPASLRESWPDLMDGAVESSPAPSSLAG